MTDRLKSVTNHLQSSISNASGFVCPTKKSPDDIVIIEAKRSAITKGFKGSFKDLNTDYLLQQFLIEFLKALPENLGKNPALIEEIVCGNVLNPGAGATEHRSACLGAGIPYTTSFMALNRQCSSGLTAVNDVANKIKTGQIEIGLALGVESMTKNYASVNPLGRISEEMKINKEARKCLIPMGITNENIAQHFNISREQQDEFAANSYKKASTAIKNGLFEKEILPLKTPEGKVVSVDEGPREGVTVDSLGNLKPAFIKDKGTTTAGNASQVSDGVAGVLMTRRSVAEKFGFPVIGRYLAFQSVGVPPEVMGVGPAYAIPKVLKDTGLTIENIDVFEINEAFAAQALYCINTLGINIEKVNPKGGAIALGHPLGCTGARQVATIMNELKTNQIGVVSMCIGTGMGAAAVFVKE